MTRISLISLNKDYNRIMSIESTLRVMIVCLTLSRLLSIDIPLRVPTGSLGYDSDILSPFR